MSESRPRSWLAGLVLMLAELACAGGSQKPAMEQAARVRRVPPSEPASTPAPNEPELTIDSRSNCGGRLMVVGPNRVVVGPATVGPNVLRRVRAVLFAHDGTLPQYSADKELWCPGQEVLSDVETRLRRVMRRLPWDVRPLAGYTRQYEAVVAEGKRLIHLHLRCRAADEPLKPDFFVGIPLVRGGGACVGRLTYDATADRMREVGFDSHGYLVGSDIPQD